MAGIVVLATAGKDEPSTPACFAHTLLPPPFAGPLMLVPGLQPHDS